MMLFWRLGAASLNDWDEAIYAQIAKEIVEGGDWITLHWSYEPWFHKPPLFMWMTAVGFKLFGVSEFWARVPSALAGFGLVGCTYLIARRLYKGTGSHAIGLLSATVLLTNYTFIHFSRFGTTDITLTLFSYLAIYAYLHVHKPQRMAEQNTDSEAASRPISHQQIWAWCGVWLAIALAVMTKGVAGLGIAIALFLTVILTRQVAATLRCKSFWVGMVLAIAVVLPWHWAMVATHGQTFIDEYFLYHVVERSTGSALEGNDGSLFYYAVTLSKHFFPWVYLLPLALFHQIKRLRSNQCTSQSSREVLAKRSEQAVVKSNSLVLLIFVGVIFGGFSLASTKLDWYIVPIYPAMSIWIGALLHRAFAGRDRWMLFGMIASGTVVMVMFPSEIVFLSGSLKQGLAIVGLATLLLLSAAVLKFGWHRHVLVISLCALFLLAGIREINGSYHGYERPVAALSQAAEVPAAPQNPPPLLVAKLSERIYTPTPLFYSNRPIAWAQSDRELARLTTTQQKQDILLAAKDIKALSRRYDIDVYAEKGALVYGGIQKRSR